MRKVSLYFVLAFCVIIFCGIAAFCDSRYEYLGRNAYSTFYLDTTNIVTYSYDNSVKVWLKEILSNSGKNLVISQQKDEWRRQSFQSLSHILYCYEINLSINTYKLLEILYYSDDLMLVRDNQYYSYQNIAPNTFIELARDSVVRINQNKSPNKKKTESTISNSWLVILVSLSCGVLISILSIKFIGGNKPAVTDKPLHESEPEVIDAVFVEEKVSR